MTTLQPQHLNPSLFSTVLVLVLLAQLVVVDIFDVILHHDVNFVAVVHAQTPSCQHENERFTHCAPSTCFEESCSEVLLNPNPVMAMVMKKCSRDCRSGCQCKPGYYRNVDGRCVTELTCISCGYNEDWVDIVTNVTIGEEGIVVEEDSTRKRNKNSRPPKKRKRGKNSTQVAVDDVRVLEKNINETCNDILGYYNTSTSIISMGNVGYHRCKCAKGYYRRIEDGLCVTQETCIECGPNEVFETCRSSSCWEYNCDEKHIPFRERFFLKPCSKDCRSGCRCHYGFYRDESTGLCVSAEMCP